jgi:hypothetical protein
VQSDLDRFVALVCRELGADEARLLDEGEQASDDPYHLCGRMQGGRVLRVRFSFPVTERDVKIRRLEMLVGTFETVVEEDTSPRRRSRPPVARSLQDELKALCERASSVNAIVIDANSPVEWAAAWPQGAIPLGPRGAPALSLAMAADEVAAPDDAARVLLVSRRALNVVRGLPELAALRKGKHVRHVDRVVDSPLIAHSFAGIYLLVLVFDAPLDELRAERAILEALPRIERLVLALPPLDPSPLAGVIALRRPRRRS